MKILLAGATGVIGQPLLQRLVEAGHEVTGLPRSHERVGQIEQGGGKGLVCDVLEVDQIVQAARAAAPEIVIHQLTALPRRIDPRRVRRDLAATHRLRSEGTRNLVAAELTEAG